MAVVIAVLTGGLLSLPAGAEDGRNHENRGRQMERHHDDRGRYRREDYRLRSYEQPDYVYAPPPVYYAPPAGPPVVDFVFPLRFR
ncbi:hypothetical protein CWS72_18365 [Telmatospirillum siberiense]|uniref:Secreted protein n=2 Tax=Telmatospirillum siberiense TaxID=382514 RepID=A0A2N3PRH0_9PROT|nr:hypothetical protein CWS72_18365 [Telmatospirillum siberiense]